MTLVAWKLAEGPAFIERAFLENEGETIAVGVIKPSGDAYAYARIPLADFRAAVAVLLGADAAT